MEDFLDFQDDDFKELGFKLKEKQKILAFLRDCASAAKELEDISEEVKKELEEYWEKYGSAEERERFRTTLKYIIEVDKRNLILSKYSIENAKCTKEVAVGLVNFCKQVRFLRLVGIRNYG